MRSRWFLIGLICCVGLCVLRQILVWLNEVARQFGHEDLLAIWFQRRRIEARRVRCLRSLIRLVEGAWQFHDLWHICEICAPPAVVGTLVALSLILRDIAAVPLACIARDNIVVSTVTPLIHHRGRETSGCRVSLWPRTGCGGAGGTGRESVW